MIQAFSLEEMAFMVVVVVVVGLFVAVCGMLNFQMGHMTSMNSYRIFLQCYRKLQTSLCSPECQ